MSPAPRLFVHSLEGSALTDHGSFPPSVARLCRRALLLAGPGDAVALDEAPAPEQLEHLASLGLGPAEVVVPASPPGAGTLCERLLEDSPSLARLAGRVATVEPYLSGPGELELARRLGAELHAPPPELARFANRKSSLPGLLRELGLPRPAGTVAAHADVRSAAERALERFGDVIVRADRSIGGRAVWTVSSPADLARLEAGLARGTPSSHYLVEERLRAVCAPNLQFDVPAEGAPRALGLTDQWLTPALEHLGNRYPSQSQSAAEIERQGSALATALAERGYRGLLGIDFVELASGEVFAVELNARVNASTYALGALARALPGRWRELAFLFCQRLPTGRISGFAELRDALGPEALLAPGKPRGLLPVQLPDAERPCLDALVVGSSEAELQSELARLAERLALPASAMSLHEPLSSGSAAP